MTFFVLILSYLSKTCTIFFDDITGRNFLSSFWDFLSGTFFQGAPPCVRAWAAVTSVGASSRSFFLNASKSSKILNGSSSSEMMLRRSLFQIPPFLKQFWIGSSSERETLMCLRAKLTEQMLEKIRCSERKSNPRLTDFMTGTLPMSYRGNYSGMGRVWILITKHLPPDLSDWELLLLIVK